jgi:hypothetical protein
MERRFDVLRGYCGSGACEKTPKSHSRESNCDHSLCTITLLSNEGSWNMGYMSVKFREYDRFRNSENVTLPSILLA